LESGRLNRILAVAANTHREAVRERVLYNLLFFAILMTVSGVVLKELSIRQDEKIIKDVGLASMEFFGILIAIFIGVSLVSKEVERRSLHPLLAKPLTRSEFLLGKFFGLGFTLLVNTLVMTIGLFLTLLATRRSPDLRLLVAVFAIYLSLLVVLSVALFFSTVTTSTLAAVFTFCLVLAGRFSDVIRDVRNVVPWTPTWLVYGLYYALPNFRIFDLKDHIVYGDVVSGKVLLALTGYAFAYCTILLTVAAGVFRSRDLP